MVPGIESRAKHMPDMWSIFKPHSQALLFFKFFSHFSHLSFIYLVGVGDISDCAQDLFMALHSGIVSGTTQRTTEDVKD